MPVPVGIPEAAALASTAALWGAAFYVYYAATAEEVEVCPMSSAKCFYSVSCACLRGMRSRMVRLSCPSGDAV